MASSVAAQLQTGSDARDAARADNVARPGYNLALGYLRGFLVVLVLAHHSVIAYMDSPPPIAKSLLTQPRLWRAFPVIDSQHWSGFGLLVGFNEGFFMSLMFFVSGLFVWSSLQRKGNAAFVRDRMRRLGIPFLVAALVVAPIAYYPSYLMTGAHGVGGYLREWLSQGDWPTGPAWFVWVLLAFDLGAAALFALVPNYGDALGRFASNARQRPGRFFLMFVGASAAAYAPLAILYGPMMWTSVGPFQFQTARILHYAVYFLGGIGVGAFGIERGLLAADGVLARHWKRWTAFMLIAFVVTISWFLFAITKGIATMSIATLNTIGAPIFAVNCGASSFGMMALFVRFARRRFWIFDSLSENEYGMYLIHYMFVSWLQFSILSVAAPAVAKGLLVFVGVLLMSWGTSAALRRIPAIGRVV